jgi:Fe-Mn family superoxide dismutase
MKFKLSCLPFETNALEPQISGLTLEFHHGKHHQAYITSLSSLIQGTKYIGTDPETIIKIADGPLLHNAAQVWNHTFCFDGLSLRNNRVINGPLTDIINESFGSVSFLKETFVKFAVSIFGSGWFWLGLAGSESERSNRNIQKCDG